MKVLMKGFFKLIRYPNLIIIVLSQYLFRYFILLPLIKEEHIEPVFSHLNFALLVLSTVLIAAAGYAINDYFDIRTDRINRPHKIVVGRLISRRKAMLIHVAFNIIAVLIGIYLSYKVHSYRLASIHIVISVLLWLYSLKYKAYFLVGNLIVAFVSALTILIVWIFELYALKTIGQIPITQMYLLNFFLWAYVSYAFITSLIREIIKDIEDLEGDKKIGCSTLPVVMGINRTKYVLLFLCLITIVSLGYVAYSSQTKQLTLIFWYVILMLIIPFIYMMYLILKAKNKPDYNFLSNITKFIMIAGVASMALIFPLF
ncbi:MAG: geranylgeranylglycerol-phosphate geranylgeranyltransferase [Bacteroidota bacterium]